MSHIIYEVRAFTANGKHGNPAGVVLDADELSTEQRQAIAAGAGFSETAFVGMSEKATRSVTFFTPTTEVDLCGHATIATWSLLYQLDHVLAGTYSQETRAGVLEVEVSSDGLVFMEQMPAVFDQQKLDATTIANLLNISTSNLHEDLHPQIVSTGLRDVLVPVKEKAVLGRLQPDLPAIAEFSKAYNCSGLHVFCPLPEGDSVAAARNFAPADGIPEECATGTSSGALLCYLRKYNALPDYSEYRIEQGEAMGQLSYIYGKFRQNIVWVGGQATQTNKRLID